MVSVWFGTRSLLHVVQPVLDHEIVEVKINLSNLQNNLCQVLGLKYSTLSL